MYDVIVGLNNHYSLWCALLIVIGNATCRRENQVMQFYPLCVFCPHAYGISHMPIRIWDAHTRIRDDIFTEVVSYYKRLKILLNIAL